MSVQQESLSIAERLYRKNRNRNSDQSPHPPSDTVTTEGHKRLYHMLDQIVNMVPVEMNDHPMAKMLSAFVRESRKDLRRIPEEWITGLAAQLAEAFQWVAEGSMSDLEENT